MDADFSHDPDDLVRLYKACAEQGGDMSVGLRYVKGGRVKDWKLGPGAAATALRSMCAPFFGWACGTPPCRVRVLYPPRAPGLTA